MVMISMVMVVVMKVGATGLVQDGASSIGKGVGQLSAVGVDEPVHAVNTGCLPLL